MSEQVVTTLREVVPAPEAGESTLLLRTDAGVFPVEDFVEGAPLPKPGDTVVIKYMPPDGYPALVVLGAARVDEQVEGVPTSVTVFSGVLGLAA